MAAIAAEAALAARRLKALTGEARGQAPPALDYVFRDPELLQRALTHRSAETANNERLEFLGDGLINCIVADLLYRHYHKAREGDLTRLRSRLVSQAALAQLARRLELGPHLVLGPSEQRSGGRQRDSILADALEALIAAVYLDSGFAQCQAVVSGWIEPQLAHLPPPEMLKDPKTRLQEWLQARGQALPEYQLLDVRGESPDQRFRVLCRLSCDGHTVAAEAEGDSRRGAEQEAAARCLAQMEALP